MSGIKFGLRIPFSGPSSSRERLRESAQRAEELGFSAVFAQDHISKSFERGKFSPVGAGWSGDPSNTTEPVMHEAVTSLSYLAGITDRIELGLGVTPLPLREPILLAKQLATVDSLSQGRIVFGVGVGNITDKQEFTGMGVPFLSYAERYAQAGEYVAAMKEIWTAPTTASFHGEYLNFDDLTIYPKPARSIPIWLGAGALSGGAEHPRVKFALAHADGLMPPYLTTSSEFATMIEEFTRTADDAGRDLSNFVWCAQRRVSIGKTAEAARRNVDWIAREQAGMWQHAGYMYTHGESGSAKNIAMMTVGTGADIRAMISNYVEAGANDFDIAFAYENYDDLLAQMELFAEEVIPAFG